MSQAESPSLMKAAFIRALSPAMRMSDAVRISSGILEGMKLGNLISLRDAEKISLKNSSATEGSNVRSWRQADAASVGTRGPLGVEGGSRLAVRRRSQEGRERAYRARPGNDRSPRQSRHSIATSGAEPINIGSLRNR